MVLYREHLAVVSGSDLKKKGLLLSMVLQFNSLASTFILLVSAKHKFKVNERT